MFTGTEKHGWQCCFSYTLTQAQTDKHATQYGFTWTTFFLFETHVVSRFDWHTCVNMQFNNYMYYNYIHNVLSNVLEIITDYWRFARGIQRILQLFLGIANCNALKH